MEFAQLALRTQLMTLSAEGASLLALLYKFSTKPARDVSAFQVSTG
jgi:hypothetical protein